jgi:hypothetical protein
MKVHTIHGHEYYSKRTVDREIKLLEELLEDERQERQHAEPILLGTHDDEHPSYAELQREMFLMREVAISMAHRVTTYIDSIGEQHQRAFDGIIRDLRRASLVEFTDCEDAVKAVKGGK